MSIDIPQPPRRGLINPSTYRTGDESGTILLKVAVLAVLVGLWMIDSMEFRTLAGASMVLTFIDVKYPLILKNIFLVYVFCLFILAGSYYFPDADDLLVDMLAYVSAFLIGYHVFGFNGVRRYRIPPSEQISSREKTRQIRILERMIKAFLLVPLALLAVQLGTYGFSNYYAGVALADAIEVYANNGMAINTFTIVNRSVDLFETALYVYYVFRCLQLGSRPSLRLLALLVVGVPLVSLHRGEVVCGCVFLAVVALFGRTRSNPKLMKWLLAATAGACVAICAGVVIGQLRVDRLSGEAVSQFSTEEKLSNIVYGELSCVVMYVNIKRNIDNIGYQYGRTIALPLLFKPIPRNWIPDKPVNTSTFYMQLFEYKSYVAGYSLASGIFSDVYLNFGWYGCLAASALLGCATGRLDRIFVSGYLPGLPMYLLVHYNFYSLLRNNTGDVIGLMLITIAAYLVLKHVFDDTVKRQTARPTKCLWADA